jgi:hypothetical protein
MKEPNYPVERPASQPTGSLGEGGVRGGWLAVAHFWRYAPMILSRHSPASPIVTNQSERPEIRMEISSNP